MSKKPASSSVAMELAKQAAAAARAELAAEDNEIVHAPAAPQAFSGRWTPALLPDQFGVDAALNQALTHVVGHMQHMLRLEGLDVAATAVGGGVAQKKQSLPVSSADTRVAVREGVTGRVIRTYTTPAILGLYASQHQRNGIVVDGQV